MGGQPLSPQQVINQWQHSFEQRITLAVESLLETKHLYQSITLENEDLFDTIGEITENQSLERHCHIWTRLQRQGVLNDTRIGTDAVIYPALS
jgi:hypothetical protein